jgi:predicted ATPase
MAILIGENGVGKSQALSRIARAAIDGSPELHGEDSQRLVISRLLAFAPTNEAESVFPSDRRKRPRMWYRRFSMNRARRAKTNEYISDLIVQVARSPQAIKERFRWGILTNALQAIRQIEEIHLPTEIGGVRGFTPLLSLNNAGEQQRLLRFSSIDRRREPMRVVDGTGYPLSSGEISFLKFAAQVSLHIENGSLLLLDEPETHLHPQFISRFVWLLNQLLADTGSAAIIATHSAYFVKEVFREQVTVLRVDANALVHTEVPMLRTFGADVGAISYFVFGEDEPSALAREVETRLRQENLDWDSLYAKYKDELSLEFLNSLRAGVEQDSGDA